MNTSHTQGPWIVANRRDQRNPLLVTTSGPVFDGAVNAAEIARISDCGHQRANARLIAAAPDLLSAMHRIIGCDLAPHEFAGYVREVARAAIAKAEGQQ